ncbi:hypothetical protein [Citreimonas salinaria]|uniref:Uncharacterized protein n=1 Tax=Citreimonas salinaria TaxID=321339 RepID=A0A1H3HUP0_9RHOB|nr:hypothetical protein [Citreimonas salinaria]SDY18429.1 hypothetical protein SAMN05444340_104140 [Citreimonas salinaria]
MPNWSDGVPAKQNPGALAGATGADCADDNANRPAKDSRNRVANAIRNFLTLGVSGERAVGLAIILAARLSEEERASIAYAALLGLEEDHAYRIASMAVFGVSAGEVLI